MTSIVYNILLSTEGMLLFLSNLSPNFILGENTPVVYLQFKNGKATYALRFNYSIHVTNCSIQVYYSAVTTNVQFI